MDKDVVNDLVVYTQNQVFALGIAFGMIAMTSVQILLTWAILCVKYNAAICQ